MPAVSATDNCLIIVGYVVGQCEMRTSPAGVPIGRFLLEHRSSQMEAGLAREVYCRIPVVACGAPVANVVCDLVPGEAVRVRGFVGRANNREGEYRLVLHAAHIEIFNAD
ncbi:MAG: primosomal replication protein N [Candidatus Competibacter denitrificans]|jgi:primosomal replication protein N